MTQMSQLPNEILIDIFILYASTDDLAPGKLALVCYRWFRLAYNLPHLWTRLCARPPFSHERWSTQVSTYFARSHPFNIDVDLDYEAGKSEQLTLAMLPLLEHYPRCKRITIRGEAIQTPEGFSNIPLEALYIRVAKNTTPYISVRARNGTVEKLRTRLDVLPFCQTEGLPFGKLLISQMTGEEMGFDIMFKNIYSFLSCCPRLTTMTLHSADRTYHLPDVTPCPSPPLILSHLTELFLFVPHLTYPILGSLSLPALKTLFVRSEVGIERCAPCQISQSSGNGIRRLLAQSPDARLRSLSIEGIDMPEDLAWLMGHLGSLERLRMTHSNISNTAISTLLSQDMLPVLHTVSLVHCHRISGQILARLLEGREHTLTAVIVRGCDKVKEEHLLQMRSMFGERLQV